MTSLKSYTQETLALIEDAHKGTASKVPVTAQIHEYVLKRAMDESGITPREFYTNPKLFATRSIEIRKELGLAINLGYDVYNPEPEAMGMELVWDDKVAVSPSLTNEPILVGGSTEELEEKLDELITGMKFKEGSRADYIVQISNAYKDITDVTPTILFNAPWNLFVNIRGYNNIMFYDQMERPEFIEHALTRLATEAIPEWIEYQKKNIKGVVNMEGCDAQASIPSITDDMLANLVVPSIEKVRDIYPNSFVANWVGDSNISDSRPVLKTPEDMMEQKLKVCDFLEGQDPDVEKLGPKRYVDYAKANEVPVILCIGAAFLNGCNVKEAEDKAKLYLEEGMKYGKFQLHFCAITPTTPIANVKAVMDVVETNGYY